MKKLTSILLIFTLIFTFAACKKEEPPVQIDFDTWYNNEFIPAYQAFVKTEYGAKNAPVDDFSTLLISSDYLESVLKFRKSNVTPTDGGTITESNGIYTYEGQTIKQTVEFDNDTCSIRVTSAMVVNGESTPQFVLTIREKDDVYYIQHINYALQRYYEVSFTATNGSVKNISRIDLPYSIFAAEIPEYFAKEN